MRLHVIVGQVVRIYLTLSTKRKLEGPLDWSRIRREVGCRNSNSPLKIRVVAKPKGRREITAALFVGEV